jgi:hypothetical protein
MKTVLTNAECLKEIRAAAKKKVGLTFKRMQSIGRINGQPAYKFVKRGTGAPVITNCTLGSAYNIVCGEGLACHVK